MGVKTDTFFDDGAARRRNRIIYLVCALVVAGCGVAFLVISSGDGGGGDRSPTTVTKSGTERTEPAEDRPAEPGRPGETAPGTEPGEPTKPDVLGGPAELRAADEKLEAALDLLRDARDLGPGSKEGAALKHRALEALLSAQAAYDTWLEAHPEDERRYSKKIADIQRQIFWTRKNMPATDFPDAAGETAKNPPETAPEEPAEPVSAPRTGPTRPKPTIPPDRLIQQFTGLTRQSLRKGTPHPIVRAGRALLDDERMGKWHEQIGQVVAGAEDMIAFLDSATKALSDRVGERVVLDLRNGEAAGELLRSGDEIAIRQGGAETAHAPSDLSAAMLISLATEADFLTSGFGHRVAGAYFFHRGERGPAMEQFVRAQAQGEDLGPWAQPVAKALQGSRPLQALVAWLDLESRLDDPTADLLERIAAFRAKHRATPIFDEHREEIFAAAAAAVEARPYEVGDLWSGEKKLSSRGRVKLSWDFDDPAQLRDFEVHGNWRIEAGALVGEKGSIRLERFDTATSEVSFTLPAAMPIAVGLWHRDRNGKGAVNLYLVPEAGELKAELRHADHPIGRETFRPPSGPLTFTIQRKDEKYQVKVNRKVLFKGTDIGRRAEEKLYAIGITVRDGSVELSDLSIATTVDVDWAKSGGNRYATWIRDWYVSPGFPVKEKSRRLALAGEHWPETREFDPKATGADDKPLWRGHRAKEHRVDLKFVRPNQFVIAYQQVRVWSPDKRNAVFEIAVDDMARVWLNGDLIVPEILLGDRKKVPVKLLPGDNLLVIKSLQEDGHWYTASRFLTKDGGPMRDLQYW